MKEVGTRELTAEQIEELCELAEEASRKYVLSKVGSSKITTLNITVEAQGTHPLNVQVDVEITLSPRLKDYDVKGLTAEATERAFTSIDTYLRKLRCTSMK